MPCRKAWQPTSVFLPGESHGQRSLAGCSSWIAKPGTQLRKSTARISEEVNLQILKEFLQFEQAELRKGRGTRDQIANICCIRKKAREFQKSIYFCFSDYSKDFDCVGHNKLWKVLKELGIRDYLTCLLRNLFAAQEVTITTRHGTTGWFKIGKGVCQGCIWSPCLT